MSELLTLWKRAVNDQTDFIERVIEMLESNEVCYCLIGGIALNAYAEPVFTADLDVAVATEDPHSLDVSEPGVHLQGQFQLDPEYASFPSRAERRDVLGLNLPVASIEDLLQGKLWAAADPTRRASKHLKDLSDIARLVEVQPDLAELLPPDVAEQIGFTKGN
jgi:hypothetical protein